MKLRENIVILLMTSASLGIAFLFFLLSSVSSGPDYRAFDIESGMGFRGISEKLYDEGFIRSPKIFMVYGALTGAAHQLKPGSYLLSSGSSTPSILNVIEEGPSVDAEVTFPEGMTLKDMDTVLAQQGILPKGSLGRVSLADLKTKYPFLAGVRSLEGFLFPDTYRFYKQGESRKVVEKILDNFSAKAQPLLSACQVSSGKCQGLNENEILTVASLLEKEAPLYRDKQMIAGIIYKRMRLGMALQIDATITYAKCLGYFMTCADPKVYRKDLEFDSPYNTYSHNELPPGPIGNPGLDSIKAALNPIKSEYLYYLSDPKTKKTIFSKTLEEHIDNRAKYLGS